jgi:hypothetical protein
MDVPLEILDREIAHAAAQLDAARAELARGDLETSANPLARLRRVSTRATFRDLAEAKGPLAAPATMGPQAAPNPAPPLAAPLRAWVYALTLERVLWDDTARVAATRRAPSITIAEPGIPTLTESPRDLVVRVIREQSVERRRVFADGLARGAGPARDAARMLAERRAEATRLLGIDGAAADAIEIPVDPPAAITTIAERLLADTAALVDRHEGWHAALVASTGRSFGEGWPARLRARWLFELFHKTTLTEGLRVALPPLPEPIGAASFARALAAFGAAYAEAARPRGFFVIARAPFDLQPARRAALFGALAADPIFAARALGLGSGRARDQARGVARALLLSLRLDAARVLARGLLARPAREVSARFEELTAAALGAPIPPALAGVVPRLDPSDPVRFAGALLALADHRSLVERFDEDWFKSPHAARALREEDGTIRSAPTVPAAAIEAGLAELVRALGALS